MNVSECKYRNPKHLARLPKVNEKASEPDLIKSKKDIVPKGTIHRACMCALHKDTQPTAQSQHRFPSVGHGPSLRATSHPLQPLS